MSEQTRFGNEEAGEEAEAQGQRRQRKQGRGLLTC